MEPRGQERKTTNGYEEFVLANEALQNVQSRYVPPVLPTRVKGEAKLRVEDVASSLPANATSMLGMLSESIVNEVVLPILRGRSRESCLRTFGAKWHEFCETLHALHVLIARVSSEEKARSFAERASESAGDSLRRAAHDLAGAQAEGEVDFAIATYSSALRLVASFETLPDLAKEALREDRDLARQFNGAAALHTLGSLLILAAADAGAHRAAVELAFEFVRAGAMQAYVAARHGHDLRLGEGESEPIDEDLVDPMHAPSASPGHG